jgi:hypothetical protein
MENVQREFNLQSQVYLLRRELLAVYSDDLGKGCIHVPPAALITVYKTVHKQDQRFLRFSWDRRTLRAFAEDVQNRSELLASTLVQRSVGA